MPSSFSFILNSSSSSSENDSKSDQSDDDNDINIGFYTKRINQNDNDMLERPSDHDDSCSQSDDTDNDDEKENAQFTSSHNPRSLFLTRQRTLYDDDRPNKSSINEIISKKSVNRGEATLLEIERDETLFKDSTQRRLFSPERSKSVSTVDRSYQSRNNHTSLLISDFTASAQEFYSIPEPDNMQTALTPSKTKANTIRSPSGSSKLNEDTRQSLSRIPRPINSPSQSRSRSPATTTKTNRRVQSPATSSKIPIPVSTTSKGAFRFFTADDRPSSQLPPRPDSTQTSSQTNKQISPFAPITHPKTFLLAKKTNSSAGNTPSAKSRRARLPSSDDDDDLETNNLKEDDLKIKLKEEKRYGKKTGELLNQLHENYEELLEKYAQAENTIDQLRFQPKFFGENTPPTNSSEGTVHFIQQPRVNISTLRSNGVYHSTTGTPLSSIRQVPSTTTTTSAVKSTSPANSGTIESVFFDEPVPQKIIVQELTTPDTIKLDLLIQTKTLSEKMRSFLTLMDANQLSLAEQKQVYESIKEDYEKLLKTFDRTKHGNDIGDIDLDGDLNEQLETMKQLLKEIVKRITDNLLGKSSNGSETGRHSRMTRDGSQSSQLSARSSLCNHNDLMDQYQKLLNAVNSETVEKKNELKSLHKELESGSRQLSKTNSRDSLQSDSSGHLPPTTKSQKPYLYGSGNSDDDQQRSNDTTSIPLMKKIESTSYDLDYIPSRSGKHHPQINDEQTHTHGIATTKKKKSSNKREIQNYDNLENLKKPKRKTKSEQKKTTNHYHSEKELTPSSLSTRTGDARYSASSMRTRTSDYDSGIGTNNTTKLSRDSKLNTSTMDESHYQSLEEDRRRYSDETQESMTSVSSSRSSGSGAVSPGSPYDKYTKRFNSSSSLKHLNQDSRRKPSGHSDTYASDVETHITGSFDPLPQPSLYQKRPRRNHHSWQPQRTNSSRSHLPPFHRSVSNESIEIDNNKIKSHRPQTAPQMPSKPAQYYKIGRKYQSGFIQQQTNSPSHPETMYKSSFYIDQPHTHQRSQDKIDLPYTPSNKKQTTNLYLDPQTGTVYRYIPQQNQPSTVTYLPPTAQVKSSKELYQCSECGSLTTYHHRHHMRRVTTDIDDPGYESGNRKLHRYVNHLTSSDSDPDEVKKSTYLDMVVLNEAYERAKKVQHRSQNLSKHISRQLKLVLATI